MAKRMLGMMALIVVLAAGTAYGEEHFGIPVYPGAKPDAAASKFCSFVDPTGKFAYCFRTSDSFEKVVAFYKKQANLKPGLNLTAEGMSSAAFCPKEQSGCPGIMNGIDVVMQTPWSANMNLPANAKAKDREHKDVRIRIYNKDLQMKSIKRQ